MLAFHQFRKTLKLFLSIILMVLFAPTVSSANEVPSGKYMDLRTDHGKVFKVYVSGSENAVRGILLVHGWLGLNKSIESIAEQFAANGYRAMAIDLYGNQIATNPKDAKKLMNAVKQSDANEKYASALKVLATPGRKLATIGWSFGASQALHATLSEPKLVSATVCYYPYGEMVSDKKLLAPMKGPILIQVGDRDFAFTPEKVQQYKAAMSKAGIKLQLNIYKNAKHSFDKKKHKNYNQAASEKAQISTYAFLDQYLK